MFSALLPVLKMLLKEKKNENQYAFITNEECSVTLEMSWQIGLLTSAHLQAKESSSHHPNVVPWMTRFRLLWVEMHFVFAAVSTHLQSIAPVAQLFPYVPLEFTFSCYEPTKAKPIAILKQSTSSLLPISIQVIQRNLNHNPVAKNLETFLGTDAGLYLWIILG